MCIYMYFIVINVLSIYLSIVLNSALDSKQIVDTCILDLAKGF